MFLNPSALIWLWIVPIIVLFYFLKLKREQKIFPSTLLWYQMIQDMQVNSPFQKLKNNVLLLLQLLIAFFLILALMRPFWAKEIVQGRNILVFIDNSASMQTVEESQKTRLELAKEIAQTIIEDCSNSDRMMLASFGNQVWIHSSLTESQKDLTNALEQIQPSHVVTQIQPVLILADTLTNRMVNPKIVIVTDACITSLSDILNNFYGENTTKIIPEFVIVGKQSNNVGIVSFEVKRFGEQAQAFCRIQNLGEEEVQGFLSISINGISIESETKGITLKPGDIQGIVWPSLTLQEGYVSVHFQVNIGQDTFELDNHAYCALGSWIRPKILLCSKNRFLNKALLTQNLDIEQVSMDEVIPKISQSEYDMVFLDHWNSTEPLPPGNYVCFNSVPTLSNFEKIGEISTKSGRRLEIIDQKDDHPILQFVELRKLNITKALELRWPENTLALLEAENKTLIGYFSRENSQYILIAFDLWNSDWPLEISFPVFIHNAIAWIIEQRYRFHQQVGKPFILPLPREISQANIITPNEKTIAISRPKNAQWTYSQNDRLGLYQVEYKKQPNETSKIFLSSYLGSLQESTIKPPQAIRLGSQNLVQDSTKMLNREIWQLVVLIVFFITLLEWYWFHRRSLSIWQFLPKKNLQTITQ